MDYRKASGSQDFVAESQQESCRIETRGGTVYWLSAADDDGLRWIVREHLRNSDTNTMVMHKFSTETEVDLADKFRGRVASDISVGAPFVLEVVGREARIFSEPVVAIEVGNVPEMIFG